MSLIYGKILARKERAAFNVLFQTKLSNTGQVTRSPAVLAAFVISTLIYIYITPY
jgi:hypothetical protein